MKSSAVVIAFILVAHISGAQSFLQIKDKFQGKENVFSFSASGFVARSILWVAGEHDFRHSISRVDRFRLITIPKKVFAEQRVSVRGMKNLIEKDSFVEMLSIKDHGDDVTIYIQEGKGKKNHRYFLIVDSQNEVVVMEMKGYIEPDVLSRNSRLSFNEEE